MNKEKGHSSSLGAIRHRALVKELRLDELMRGVDDCIHEIILLNYAGFSRNEANAIVNESWQRFKENKNLVVREIDAQERAYEGRKNMTLKELIDKATQIGRQITDCDIPVVYNGVSGNIKRIELSQDNNGNYYVNIS